jgi:hypothetical protein
LNFAWNNNFKLPLGISLDVDLGFDTPGDNENTKVEEWCWFANISLYKSFLKDRLSVQLKAYDRGTANTGAIQLRLRIEQSS